MSFFMRFDDVRDAILIESVVKHHSRRLLTQCMLHRKDDAECRTLSGLAAYFNAALVLLDDAA